MRMHNTCDCGCGCDAAATTLDDSAVLVCAECADYYLDADGEVVCSREQGDDMCRDCGEGINWTGIMTGAAGVPNWREGSCSCRSWAQRDHGGRWQIEEVAR